MKNFKYPLAIEGAQEQLEALMPKLEGLGYLKFKITNDWDRRKFLVTRLQGSRCNWGHEWIFTNLDNTSQDTKNSIHIPASNPDLVLALAAMVDDDKFYEGEKRY